MDKNPDSLVWNVFAGADGEFELYEDDNVSQKYLDGVCIKTKAKFVWESKKQEFKLYAPSGDLTLIPSTRAHMVKIWGVEKPEAESVRAISSNNEEILSFMYDYEKKCLVFELKYLESEKGVTVVFSDKLVLAQNRIKEQLFTLLNKAEIPFETKGKAYYTIVESDNLLSAVNQIRTFHLPEEVEGAIMEIMLAY